MEMKSVIMKHQFSSARDMYVKYSVDSDLNLITINAVHFDSVLMINFLTKCLGVDVLHKNEDWIPTSPKYSVVLFLGEVKYRLELHSLPSPSYPLGTITVALTVDAS
jgi:hypothetical protein